MAIPAPRAGNAALVTGASSGIGQSIACQLAERGHDLVLVARRRDRLENLAAELTKKYRRRVEVLTCDVADAHARTMLFSAVQELGVVVDVLVLSAGYGMGGPFIEQDPDRVLKMLRTNLEGVVLLARAFAPRMHVDRSGAILIVSSMAGNQPMPYFGAYAASKAAVTSFAEMLHEELRASGVTVTALCPGEVVTEFTAVADMAAASQRMPRAFKISPQACARSGLRALDKGRRTVMPRMAVRALSFIGGHAPRGLWLRISRRLMA